MIKNQSHYFRLTAASFLSIILFSCNYNPGEIAFPEKELGYSQPVTVPLQFTPARKLNWDTAKQGGINPVIKKLDIDALPSIPYDTSGFKPFTKPTEEVRFDFNSLPETNCNIEKLPSHPLQFKTRTLAPPAIIKASTAAAQKGKPLSIFDFGQIQGLQAKFITSLVKDKNGLMWIASGQGLFRYDGEHIQTFIPGPLSVFINGMVEDNNGRIWYTDEKGIGMIDPQKNTHSFSPKIAVVKDNLSKMFKDESGLIWVNNNLDKAVSIIDPQAMTFKNLDMKAGLSDSAAYEILEDNNKNIWITTYNGGANIINIKASKIKYLKKVNGLSSDTLSAIVKDEEGQVWISIAEGGTGGLDAVNINKGTIRHYNLSQAFKNRYTFYLSFDNKGKLWKGTSSGVELIDVEKGMIRLIDQKDGMAGNVILSCTLDNYNRMWLATTQGLNIIDQNGETVHPFGTTNIVSLIEDAMGNLWVATQKGVVIVDAKKNVTRLLDKSKGLSNDFVQSFMKINGNILVATNGGFNIIDPIHKTMESAGKKEGLVNDTIYAVFKDKAGNTWLTGPSNGVDMVDSAKKMIRHAEVTGGLSDNNIQDIKQDKGGLIWLATNRGGVDIIDPIAGTVKYLNNLPGLKDTCNRVLLPDEMEECG